MTVNGGPAEKSCILFGGVCALLLAISGNGLARDKIFTIGMMHYVSIHSAAMDGFKAGMAELGYVEGKNVKFLYNGVIEGTPEKIDAEINNLLKQKVDLFFTMGNYLSGRVKDAVKEKGVPVLLAASSRPVEAGLVDSIGRPGGNVTGVQVADTVAKSLEWLHTVVPEAKRVLLPFNPDDVVSVNVLADADGAAEQLGLDLIHCEVHSVEEARAAILNLPEDVDAVFRIASPTLDMGNSELSRAAIEKKRPMISSLPLDESVLLTCATEIFAAGKQTARQAHLIRRGIKPADIPVETAEVFLTVNLKTAEKIGLYIPDEVLMQAKTIIRQQTIMQ